MRILLFGEYSNLHWTLAEGLRTLGHEVHVVSNGDTWKSYARDISLQRKSNSTIHAIGYLFRLFTLLPRLRNYDVVQLINPSFLDLKAKKILPIYHYLKRHNKKIFLGAFGVDHYWVKRCSTDAFFRYSDFNIGEKTIQHAINKQVIKDWLNGDKGVINREIAQSCNGIISCLYEYDVSYRPYFPQKTAFIPLPTRLSNEEKVRARGGDPRIKFFIGIQKHRSQVKGTDILYRALYRVQEKYPDQCEIIKAESVPFPIYQDMMNQSDVLLDQLYSYTPAMNGLLAMAKGLVLVGGGEEENYEILGERELRPIINVLPDEEDVFNKLEQLVLHKERIPELSRQSIEYIKKHHDHIKVAQQYVDFWNAH